MESLQHFEAHGKSATIQADNAPLRLTSSDGMVLIEESTPSYTEPSANAPCVWPVLLAAQRPCHQTSKTWCTSTQSSMPIQLRPAFRTSTCANRQQPTQGNKTCTTVLARPPWARPPASTTPAYRYSRGIQPGSSARHRSPGG